MKNEYGGWCIPTYVKNSEYYIENEGKYLIIPSHMSKHHTQKQVSDIYWLVTLALTSGKNVEFYVKARTNIEALIKVNDLDYLVKINYFKGEFKLLP